MSKKEDILNFGVNLSLHALILFSFLSIFFTFYIAKLSQQALEAELRHNIGEGLSKYLSEQDNQEQLKALLKSLPYDTINKIYQNPEKARTVHNQWLFKTILIINIALWIMFIVVNSLLMYRCNEQVDLKGLLMENAIVFTCIGVVEYLFFTRIALKFVPVEPSVVPNQFLTKFTLNVTK